jgi:hypothetical protein
MDDEYALKMEGMVRKAGDIDLDDLVALDDGGIEVGGEVGGVGGAGEDLEERRELGGFEGDAVDGEDELLGGGGEVELDVEHLVRGARAEGSRVFERHEVLLLQRGAARRWRGGRRVGVRVGALVLEDGTDEVSVDCTIQIDTLGE